MKKYRTKADWLSLIDEFEQSGLTQSAFCAKRGLNTKYFSLRRMKFKADDQRCSFIQAKPAAGESATVTVQYGSVSIQIPATHTPAIVQLVKSLSA